MPDRQASGRGQPRPLSFGGVIPSLCLRAGLGPPRSECAAWAR